MTKTLLLSHPGWLFPMLGVKNALARPPPDHPDMSCGVCRDKSITVNHQIYTSICLYQPLVCGSSGALCILLRPPEKKQITWGRNLITFLEDPSKSPNSKPLLILPFLGLPSLRTSARFDAPMPGLMSFSSSTLVTKNLLFFA